MTSLTTLPLFLVSVSETRHVLFFSPTARSKEEERTNREFDGAAPAPHRWKKEGDSAAALRNNRLVSKRL